MKPRAGPFLLGYFSRMLLILVQTSVNTVTDEADLKMQVARGGDSRMALADTQLEITLTAIHPINRRELIKLTRGAGPE